MKIKPLGHPAAVHQHRFPRPPIGGIASEVLALRGISPDLISRLYGEGKDVSIIVQGTLCAEQHDLGAMTLVLNAELTTFVRPSILAALSLLKNVQRVIGSDEHDNAAILAVSHNR